MKAVHFGAGNIGRGFIGEILFQNGFSVDFADVNDRIINALKERKSYTIELAEAGKKQIQISNASGINNQKDPEAVISAISEADLVTTAIGPKVLPYIAELIAFGIQRRKAVGNAAPLDIIACENMIGGSQFLFSEVKKYLTDEDQRFVAEHIGFPNAAVDRIVPIQHHEDPLFVSVEPFCEWVIDDSARKARGIQLAGVEYVPDLEPYIERKLFSVNTGHATVAYTGAYYGYQTIDEAMKDDRVLTQIKNVLAETGSLLMDKWGFDRKTHQAYIDKIIQRFQNPYISDDITRVARTPIRKLGYNERFIRPVRELKERHLPYEALLETIVMILAYDDLKDEECVKLQSLIKEKGIEEAVRTVSEIQDAELLKEIKGAA